MTPSEAQPETQPNHLVRVLWGVAVLGVLMLTIRDFGQTKAALNQFVVHPHGGNYWLLTLTNTLLGSPSYALLIVLFGAGIALFFAQAGSVDTFIRRQFWLMAFGLVNAIVLLWPNDLLFPLAVVGILVFTLHRLSARGLLVGAMLMGLIFGGKGYWSFSETQEKYQKYQTVMAIVAKNKKLDGAASDGAASRKKKQIKLTEEQKADTTAWKGIVNSTKFDKKANAGEVTAMRGTYDEVWGHVLPKAQFREARWLYQLGIWELASLLLLGMALVKWDFFSDGFGTRQYALLAVLGLLVGQGLTWISMPDLEARLGDMTKYVTNTRLPLYDLLLPFVRAASAVGLAALVAMVYRAGVLAWFWRAVGAVGEMPLTNYLLQTVLCTALFYGYGMGFFGDLKPGHLYFIVLEMWIIQTVFSVVWLRMFRLGPAEWLWHSLVRWERQPLQRPPLTDADFTVQSTLTV